MISSKHVVAVAGGGKTTYLVAQIREAMERVHPDKIIAVTYTRNMARELKQKIGVNLKYCGTLHHILYTLLCEEHPGKYLSIVNEVENADIVKELASAIGLKLSIKKLPHVLTTNDILLSYLEKHFKRNYYNYFERYKSISYPLIEILGSSLIKGGEWDCLFVDEYQDMSLSNIDVINNINAITKLYVYDPMQSIYGFRGAEPEKLEEGDKILDKTYRCPSSIVDAANHLIIMNNAIKYPVVMTTDKIGGEFEIVRANHDFECIRGELEKLLDKYEPRDIAILARTNKILETAQEQLSGLPIQRVSSHVLSSPEMMAYKYLLRIHPIADLYNIMKFAVASKIIKREDAAKANYINPVTGLPTITGENAAKDIMEDPAYKACITAIDKYGAVQAAKTLFTLMDARDWIASECISIITWLHMYYGDDLKAIDDALGEMDTDALVGDSNNVKLMTIHTAKGLEYKAVLIINVRNGILPHINADEEEELRLLYVAITRASEKCVIIKTGKQSWLDNYYTKETSWSI